MKTEQIATLMGRLHGGAPLSKPERVVALVVDLDQQVHSNESLEGVFASLSGDWVPDTIEALNACGAVAGAKVLQQACEAFPGGSPARDIDGRLSQLDASPETSEALAALLERWDGCADETWALVTAFAQAHAVC
jgi:hypothetical protein